MKSVLISIAGVAALSLSAQNLVFDKTIHDFGIIPEARKVTEQFAFRNAGSEVLKITNVKASCGCTAGTLAKDILAPGEKSTVEISFDPEGKSGSVRKYIKFTTNSPVDPVKTIYITANIEALWDFQPRTVRFLFDEDGFEDGRTTGEFVVLNRGEKILSILDVTSSNRNITFDGPRKLDIEPGKKQRYTVNVDPEFRLQKSGLNRITFKTKYGEDRKNRAVQIYIRKTASSTRSDTEGAKPPELK